MWPVADLGADPGPHSPFECLSRRSVSRRALECFLLQIIKYAYVRIPHRSSFKCLHLLPVRHVLYFCSTQFTFFPSLSFSFLVSHSPDFFFSPTLAILLYLLLYGLFLDSNTVLTCIVHYQYLLHSSSPLFPVLVSKDDHHSICKSITISILSDQDIQATFT